MKIERIQSNGLRGLLGRDVRQVERNGNPLFALDDVVAALAAPSSARVTFSELTRHDPSLHSVVMSAVQFPARSTDAGAAIAMDATDLYGVFRIAQAMPGRRAARFRRWLAAVAVKRIEEAENPELAVMRLRKLYARRGYGPRWVATRVRGMSARQELTAEWFKRGARESDEFRALTNHLMGFAFGMEVEAYRRFKNLQSTRENLRDHMTDMELALTTLGETIAVHLHRERDSRSLQSLDRDAKDAGEVVAATRQEIERRIGRSVVEGMMTRRDMLRNPASAA